MAARRQHTATAPTYTIIFDNHPLSLEGQPFTKRQALRGLRNQVLATGTLLKQGRVTYWLGERNGKADLYPIKGRRPRDMAEDGGSSDFYCTGCGSTNPMSFKDNTGVCSECQSKVRRATRI